MDSTGSCAMSSGKFSKKGWVMEDGGGLEKIAIAISRGSNAYFLLFCYVQSMRLMFNRPL